MRIQSATEPGTPGLPNEDYTAVATPASGAGGVLVLLDGVTAPPEPAGCRHSVAWFSSRLGGALLELLGSRSEMTPASCLAEAIRRTADAHRETCDLSHRRTPQATVVCARWTAETVEYLVLSDSVLLIEDQENGLHAVLDTRLADLRPAAARLPRGERAAFVEGLRNAPGGFYTAAADPAVAELAVTGSSPRARVRSLVALSDGLGRWVDTFGLGDWADLFQVLVAQGPQAVINQVRAAELADPAGTTHPRGKAHDDASVVLAEL
ncbi:hypothetical protein E1265_22225 [Streptomyces sp. 8K308]|uniref:protein phosphatase 2C domain-containing protein n=1 Tax=Streptomyces sp. 8K308 TaxID=2530388 RepID=UPI00104EB6CD|nr:protein phosphatase 2C domain-containing protein [Streptomyces sp. 8K308]TDC20446.1 hypothetical protein E1265_22225 [Streptomyces sp. 8K308]